MPPFFQAGGFIPGHTVPLSPSRHPGPFIQIASLPDVMLFFNQGLLRGLGGTLFKSVQNVACCNECISASSALPTELFF